ncbi:TorF family putative porin [Lentibacillus cibarius]|uniref:VCBS repeat-containing protein n=1 Tax=Lentibacillus cibarius TaxID=2583219 RepID=A0A5S3QJ34_9BACI|nr:hypothetical protein [Lentibacillus cibarius]TMN21221.1 hypothetical protein FFL34_03165 [Lentibacillus cibarius]
MKKIVFLLLATLLLPATMFAEKNNEPSPQQLAIYKEDITGNAEEETIELTGLPFADNTGYYVDTWASLVGNDGKKREIQFSGGYKPQLLFHDLNHDGIKDILYQSVSEKTSKLHHYQLYTFDNGHLKKMPFPEQKFIKTMFKNNFTVEVQVAPDKDPAIVDVSDHATKYVHQGIYDENGKLLEKTSPMIQPISNVKPVKISEQKGYGLKSEQPISGAYPEERLGTVETLWYFEKGQWIILKTEWISDDK